MRTDKTKATELRAKGKTYREISSLLGVPKSTLSAWFSKDPLSADVLAHNKARNRAASLANLQAFQKVRRQQLDDLYEQARREAREEFHVLKHNPLFFTALALYWGEGDKKTDTQIRITNIEPKLIKIFIRFVQEILNIDRGKIKVGLLIYPDLDAIICRNYWSESLGLPLENFNKVVVIQGRHKVNRLSYGVCGVGFCSTYLKQKIQIWLDMLAKHF